MFCGVLITIKQYVCQRRRHRQCQKPVFFDPSAQAGAQFAHYTASLHQRQGLTATIFGPDSAKDPVRKAHTMTISLSDNLSLASPGQNTGTLELKSESNTHHDGQSFGQFMSEMFQVQADGADATAQAPADLAQPQGQQIADPLAFVTAGTPLETLAWPLKATTLGPHLNVITPDTTAPDTQSLEAFARAQGLDEQAVSWLFGASASGSMGSGSSLANINIPQSNTITNTPITPPLGIQIQAGVPTDAMETSVTGQAPGANTALQGAAVAGLQALWAMAEEPGKTTKPSPSNITTPEEALPIQMLRMPPPAAVWMQRGIMNSVLQDNVSAQKQALISTSELDLGADWGGDTLQQLLGTEGSASNASSTGTHGTAYANFASRWDAQAANRNDLANAHGPAQDLPDTQARSENIQNLADKMGQAVGQRILSEMEKGQWHLKLQLRPATLGHIEVEMRMRSGEFDAVFTAPNGTTRDLLQDGMGKLRETLAQMGMDVATIHVGNGQTGHSGGDSTPGSPRGKSASVEANATENAAETIRAPRVKDPSDGLDVLV